MPPPKDVPPPVIPGYRVLKTIGRGGFGAVYLAEQESLGGMVAIKSFLPEGLTDAQRREFMERFRREARLLARLRGHENIVQVFDWTKDASGNDYIVMEHVDGYSVAAWQKLQPTNQLPIAEAVRIVREAAKGLQAAHETGIIHRDVKPENLMILEKSGRVKVMDFGTAQGGGTEETKLTRHGVSFGTPFYMSPEQFQGADKVDVRSDVYSLAVVLYNLVAGRVPFYDTNPFSLAKKIEQERPPLPSQFRPGLYPPLEAIILKGMAKNPADRYQGMVEFERALGQFIEKFSLPSPKTRGGNETETAPEGAFFGVARGAKTVPAARALDDSIAKRSSPGSPFESHRLPASDPPAAAAPHAFKPSPHPAPTMPDRTPAPEAKAKGPVAGGATGDRPVSPAHGLILGPAAGDAAAPGRHQPATIEFDFPPAPPAAPPKGLKASTGRTGLDGAARQEHPPPRSQEEISTLDDEPAPPRDETPAISREAPATSTDPMQQAAPRLENGPSTAPFAVPFNLAEKKPGGGAACAPSGDSGAPFAPSPSSKRPPVRDSGAPFAPAPGKPGRRPETPPPAAAKPAPPPAPAVANRPPEPAPPRSAPNPPAARQPELKAAPVAPRPAEKPREKGTAPNDQEGSGGLLVTLLLIVAIAGVGVGIWALNRPPIVLPLVQQPVATADGGANPGAAETPSLLGEGEEVRLTKLPDVATDSVALELGLGEKIVLRWCPAGSFLMGSANGTPGGDPDERPPTTVAFAKGFWISETEVTIGQWRAFAERTGYATANERKTNVETWRKPNAEADASHPVAYVSWFDANRFCEWLTRDSPCVVMLPTEAEWEYACRARSTSQFAWGDDWRDGQGWLNSKDAAHFRSFRDATAARALRDEYALSAPAGSFKANAWGLKDMHGNVWEWCRDYYGAPYPGGQVENYLGAKSGTSRVIRGGSWNDHPDFARSANRGYTEPEKATQDIGFRVVAYPR
jgi:formylglycine-generating enzyme required for sulfatase activity/serine/threonine protein kinase